MEKSESAKRSFWDFKTYTEGEWFKFLALSLIILSIVYASLHFFLNDRYKLGYEYSKLEKVQMEQITRIYFDTAFRVADSTSNDIVDNFINNLDTAKNERNANEAVSANATTKSDSTPTNSSNCSKVVSYLKNQFNNKIDHAQIDSLKDYLCRCTPLEATGFLSNVRLQIQSYFWLTGPGVYFEIIFWSWFGVLCSLLFNLGVIGKNRTTNPTDPTTYFDSSEIPFQIAKLLYAPACTLIIVLGYNFFADQNIVDISSSKGVMVFAFLGGFYSSRLIAFLDRLKEILLPISSHEGISTNTAPLKNVVVQVQLDEGITSMWDSLKGDLSSLKVTLQQEQSTQQAIALNIDDNQWPIYIFDYVKPGTYTIEASCSLKEVDEVIQLKAEQKFEMKDIDKSVTLKLMRS